MRYLATFLLLAIPLSARAASISITPVYVQSFDSALLPLGELPNDGAATPAGGYLQFEFRMQLIDTGPGEDFWTAIFNVNLGAGLENSSGWLDPGIAQANGYYPAAPSLSQFDSNGPVMGGIQAHWQFGNDDFGLEADDLQSIIVEASESESANRQYGEAIRPAAGAPDGLGSSTLIGAVLVRRAAFVPTQISVSPIAGSAWGLYVDNAEGSGDSVVQPGNSFAASTLVIGVPEPGTWALAWMAAVALAACALRHRKVIAKPLLVSN